MDDIKHEAAGWSDPTAGNVRWLETASPITNILSHKPLAFNRQMAIVDILTELGAALESGGPCHH